MGRIHLEDYGTRILITCTENGSAKDISGATLKYIVFKKPVSGTSVTETATFFTDGTDGKIYYDMTAGELDEAGVWELQAYVVFNTGQYRSTKAYFKVYPNL